jgi:O-antigen ligase
MEAVAIIAAIVAIVWGTVYSVRGSLVCGCLATLVVAFCFGHPFWRFEIGPLPMTLDRVMLAGLILVYIIQRRLGRADPKPAAWPDIAMLLLAAVLVFSTFSHDWRLDAPGKVSPVWRLVAGFLSPMALYWIARQSRIEEKTLQIVYGVLTAFGVYLAVTALAEVTQQWWMVFPPYISDPTRGIHFGRARGAVLQSQSLGLHLDACLLCLWMQRRHLGRVGLLVSTLLIPVFLAAIFVTYTRCVWIGAALCALTVLGLPMSNRWRAAIFGPALAAALLLAIFQWDNLIHMERPEGGGAAGESVDTRSSFSYVSWKMFLDQPLLGVGYGQFQDAARSYLSDRDTSLYLESIRGQPNHNMFLALLTETGLVGGGLFIAILVGWAIGAWRLWRDAASPDWVRTQGLLMLGMLGIYLGPALFFDLTFSPHDNCITFFMAGLTAGLWRRGKKDEGFGIGQ